MVSIVAAEIYNETKTVNHSNNANFFDDTVFSGNEFDAATISNLTDFTYLEGLQVEVSLDEITLKENQAPAGEFDPIWLVEAPVYNFNNTVDLFGDVNTTDESIRITGVNGNTNGQTFTNQSGTAAITIDKYIDTPATIQPVLRTTTSSEFAEETEIDGNQNVDYTIVITAIGRQP